jgi:hypothetical protein
MGRTDHPSFKERFGRAYDVEIQRWVNAVRAGGATGDYTDGPTAWDGLCRSGGVRCRRPVLGDGRDRRRRHGLPRIGEGSLSVKVALERRGSTECSPQ